MTGTTAKAGKRATYPAYKPSGMDWVGDVPEHWDVRRLKYSATINDEALPETTDPDYEFTYVDIGSVDASKGIVATETYRFEDAPSRARRIVRDGDTIVSTVRTYLRAIAAIRDPEENLIVSTGFAVVRPRSLDPGYLSYALRSPFFVETVVSRSTGVSYPAINAPEVGNIGVTLPPLDEQKAIAAFLDRETARIDALIEKKRRQIELLQEKRSALISHAVTKGLDPNAPMKDSGIEWLGQAPAHWNFAPLKHVASFINGAPFKPSEWQDEGVPIIRIENLNGGEDFNCSGDEVSGKYHVQKGDLLFGWSGNRGTSFGPFIWWREGLHYLNQHIFRIVDYSCDKAWLYWALKAVTFYVEKQAHGIIGMVHITKGDLGIIRIPIISTEEQEAIAWFLSRETKRIDVLVETARASIETLGEFRIATISAAVTGKIDVRGFMEGTR